MKETIILGIDPGFDRLGIAVISKSHQARETVLYTECYGTDRSESLDMRIFVIGQHIQSIIERFKPNMLAIETLFATKNLKTVMGVAEARGVIKYVAQINGLVIHEYSPNQIKTAIAGSGSATKDQIQYMVPKLVFFDMESRKTTYKGTSSGLDDEIDALAVALTCSAIERFV
jgi:crossover junction endodeoxyribonuclease RuvC